MSKEDQAKLKKDVALEMLLCTQYGWKQHPKYEGFEACKICFDDLNGKYVLETGCGHVFDYACVLLTLSDYHYRSCPDCSVVYTKQAD